MYICICSQVTDGQVKATVKEKGMTRVQEVCRELGICNQCGKCANEVRRLVVDCQEPLQTPHVRAVDGLRSRLHLVDRTGYASCAVGNG
ncbi:MAG: (2Fe-2S)-binding protein [Methylococcaceae bacterium]